MEEGDKDGALKAEQRIVLIPTARPRPAPRKRSNQPKPETTVQNGKPENIPPKPALHPKPRRPPPKAPNVKPPEKGVTNNNGVPDKQPSVQPELIKEIISNNLNIPKTAPSRISPNKLVDTKNGSTNLVFQNSTEDEQLYEPLRARSESSSSSSDDGYEAIVLPR